MTQPKYWDYSFRFMRIGQTSLWQLDRAERGELPAPAWSKPGAFLGLHDEKCEWVGVHLESAESEDLDQQADEAESLAIANFRERHPTADLKV